MASGPTVAVIGGGIAGLVCAARLGQLGISNVRVFDTGIYRHFNVRITKLKLMFIYTKMDPLFSTKFSQWLKDLPIDLKLSQFNSRKSKFKR